jgi:hypothetical protein
MSDNFTNREGKSESGKAWAFTMGGAQHRKGIEAADLTEFLFTAPDNAAVIVSMAYMEEQVKNLLERFFIEGGERHIKLLDPGKPGALSTFAAMVDAAFLLGLLPKVTRKTLRTFASLRNRFAHNHRLKRFDDFSKDPKTKKVLQELMELNWMGVGGPREVFNTIYLETLSVLRAAHMKVSEQRRQEVQESDLIVIARIKADVSKNETQ